MMPSWGDAAFMWHESIEALEMVSEDVWQAMLLGALPVVVLVLALGLCQAGLLRKHDRKRELGIAADCGFGTGMRDERVGSCRSNDHGTSDLVATGGRVLEVASGSEEGDGGDELENCSRGRVLEASGRSDQECDNGVKTSCNARVSDSEEQPSGRNRTQPCLQLLSRWMFLVLSCCGLALLFARVIGLQAYLSIDSSINKAARQTTDCKIVSKGETSGDRRTVLSSLICSAEADYVIRDGSSLWFVDGCGGLPSIPSRLFSTICEVRPWKHKHISSKESKIWCYLDYYWASVLKVEYRPHLSELPMLAAAEAPRQALRAECRPDFGAVWRLNEGYQVNAIYPCKYNPWDLGMVDVAENVTGDCVPEAPPVVPDLPRYFLAMVSFLNFMRRARQSAAGRVAFSAAAGIKSSGDEGELTALVQAIARRRVLIRQALTLLQM